jgi:hypothetical protein
LPLILSIMTRSIDRSSARRAPPSTLLLTIKLAVFEFEAIGGEILCAGNHLCIDMNEIPSIV